MKRARPATSLSRPTRPPVIQRWRAGAVEFIRLTKTPENAATIRRLMAKERLVASYFVNGACVAVQFAIAPKQQPARDAAPRSRSSVL